MSVTAFRPFVTVAMEEKGSSAELRALSFEPTAATSARLADHRLVFRPRPSGFQLYAQHNPGASSDPLAPIVRPTSLLFAIRLKDASAMARYKPQPGGFAGPNLYLSNRDDSGESLASRPLSRNATVDETDMVRIVPRRLRARIALPDTGRPDRVQVFRRFDSTHPVADLPLDAPAGATSTDVNVDLSGEPDTGFRVVPKPAGPEAMLFVDEELARLGAFGVLELVLKVFSGSAPANGRNFTATFERRSATPD